MARRRSKPVEEKVEVKILPDQAPEGVSLVVVECDIVDGDGEPLLAAGMPYGGFVAGLTAVLQHDAALFWDLHKAVRESNPQWARVEEGNE